MISKHQNHYQHPVHNENTRPASFDAGNIERVLIRIQTLLFKLLHLNDENSLVMSHATVFSLNAFTFDAKVTCTENPFIKFAPVNHKYVFA